MDTSAFSDPLTYLLTFVAVVSVPFVSSVGSNSTLSPGFICLMIAIPFLGPSAAFAIALVTETATWLIERYRWRAFLNNLAAIPATALIIAVGFTAIDPSEGSWQFYLLLAVASLAFFVLNVILIVFLMSILDGNEFRQGLKSYLAFLPTIAFSIALILAVATAYIDFGRVAIAYLAVALAGVGYMTRRSEERRVGKECRL